MTCRCVLDIEKAEGAGKLVAFNPAFDMKGRVFFTLALKPHKRGGPKQIAINYCPFCGKKVDSK